MNGHRRTSITALLLLVLPTLAHAHHAMGGATPANLYQGLMSGLAHPVIGLDHLLFVLAVGVACYLYRRGVGTAAIFLAGTFAGTAAHVLSATIPYPDAWVAATLVIAGVLLLRASPLLGSAAGTGFFALAGIAHGYAYGESIAGAEPTPLFAYLLGFTLIQLAIVFCGYAAARVLDAKRPGRRSIRAFGGALSIAGSVFLAFALVA
jgi:urease accessory protein